MPDTKQKKETVSSFVAALQGKRIHVVGISGIEGYTIAEFLVRHGLEGVILHDFHPKEEFGRVFNSLHLYKSRKERKESLADLMNWDAQFCFQDSYLQGIETAEVVFLSQNWFAYGPNHPRIDQVNDLGRATIMSLSELYLKLLPSPIIGITGSVGKSTVSQLTSQLMSGLASRAPSLVRQVCLGGNDRRSGQLLSGIENMKADEAAILEISNRQLKLGIGSSPQVGVITNILPNHIDDHGDFEHYRDAKLSLLSAQHPGDIAVLNHDDAILREQGSKKREIIWFGLQDHARTGVFVKEGQICIRSVSGAVSPLFRVSGVKMTGEHNLSNVLAAIAAVYGFICYKNMPEADLLPSLQAVVAGTLTEFTGLIGRLEFVREAGGVRYYYDIKSTIPQGTVAAINALALQAERIILIAGGEEKGVDYSGLGQSIASSVPVLILLPGAGSDKIRKSVREAGAKTFICEAETFEEAWRAVLDQQKTGDAVLLSPACTGFLSRFLEEKVGFKERVKAL